MTEVMFQMPTRTIIDFGKTPSKETLIALYGDDTPVGYFATQKYKQALKACNEMQDSKQFIAAYAKAIVDYAINLQKEQKGYDDISPYGGLDIDVEPIDKIALREVESGRLYNKIRPFVIQELCHQNIDLKFCKDKLRTFESMKKEANGTLRAAYEKWVAEDKKLQNEILAAVDDRNNRGDALYKQAIVEETLFHKKPRMYRILHKAEYQEIQNKKDKALSMVGTTVDSPVIKAKFGFRLDEHLENTPYISRFNGVKNDYRYIDSEDSLTQAISEAQEYCKDPQNIAVYNFVKDAVELAEKYKTFMKTVGCADISR